MKRWREKKGVGSRTRGRKRRRSGGRTTDGEDRQTGVWLGSLRRKRSKSESTNGRDL